MKVLQLGKFYPPVHGGMETVLALLCERTASQVQNRVLVANSRCQTVRERRGGIDVERVAALTRIGAVAVCPTLPYALARAQPDLIVLHEPNPMALLAYFLARPDAPLIVWFHSEVIRPSWRYRLFYRPFLRFALSRAARIIVSSPTLAASAPQLQEWRSKCTVVPYGVEARDGQPPGQLAARVRDIREREDRPILLFAGRLVPYKGVDVLLEAMRGLDAVALIVGQGPKLSDLQRNARALGVDDRVRFLGSVTDAELAALYGACDVFVLPSVTRQEAFGVVQLEAMAAGKPVVSTDLGTGVAWVNQHGETGLVVPPRDPDALRTAIGRLLGDPALRMSLGDGAARRWKASFTVERMIAATLTVYDEVMAHHVGRKTVA